MRKLLRISPDTPGWKRLALEAAREAHEDNFSSRCGVWGFEDSDTLVIYNNNPYSDSATRRDTETAAFRAWMKAERMQELAYATYPREGKDAGYSYAMVIRMGGDRQDDVVEALDAILARNLAT
jgi:hypothetical protein